MNANVVKVLKEQLWHVATYGEDPNVVPVGFKDVTEDGKLVMGVVLMETTLKNIAANGKVAISACDGATAEGYQVKGTAEYVTEGPVVDMFKKIAEDLKISYPHFRRCFAQYTQVSIHEFLLQKRYALAVSLLKNGTESVKEIMDRCGFHTSSDFSRFIKARSGTTPSELRKQPQFTEF